jgi:acyl-coenzyme A thioesterase PaaI-like protein
MAVALNVNITYTAAAVPGETLVATVREESRTPRTAVYLCTVTGRDGKTVALGQALAYRRKTPLKEATGKG